MTWTTAEEVRVVAVETALADAIAKIGAFQTVMETKGDFNDRALFEQTYDDLKPAP